MYPYSFGLLPLGLILKLEVGFSLFSSLFTCLQRSLHCHGCAVRKLDIGESGEIGRCGFDGHDEIQGSRESDYGVGGNGIKDRSSLRKT